MEKTYSILLKEEADIGSARRLASASATQLGFETGTIAKIALIVTEAASNILKHTTQGGELILQSERRGQSLNFEIFALDKGPGMFNTEICLVDGYSTAKTPGTGLGAIKRLSTNFDIYSTKQFGTVIWAQLEEKQPGDRGMDKEASFHSSSILELGTICVPIKGEEVSGDGWASHALNPHIQLVMMVDGLGHGPEAHEVAMQAIQIFYESVSFPIVEILKAQHKGLKKTRGAALAIAKIDTLKQELGYVGIGNISGQIISAQRSHGLLSHNGIVGYQMRSLQESLYPFIEKAILVMHSDGLTSHWDEAIYSGLLQKNPSIMAGTLYRDFKRGRDDASILIARKNE